MSNNYFHPSVSSKALSDFLEKTSQNHINIIAVEIFEKDQLMLKYAPKPFSCSQKSEVYSLSKSFTSICVGIAIDMGLFTVEDYVLDFFPDESPKEPSENLKSLQVKHLLSMNSGHTECDFPAYEISGNTVKYFFDLPQTHKPGTHFFYNNGCTHMLSAIITKVSGLSLLDFANLNFLHDMGIYDVKWRKMCSKYTTGASGINVSCDDIAKLGLLYLHKGVYEGKRYVSEQWIDQATAVHSDNSENPTADWQAGYGYQVWRNHEEGFRGDGAFGQFMLVFPEREMVVAIRAETNELQMELDFAKELVKNLHDSPEIQINIPEICKTLETKNSSFSYDNVTFELEENQMGAKFLNIKKENDDLTVFLSLHEKIISIKAGDGYYVNSNFTASAMRPSMALRYIGNAPEFVQYSCCYNIIDNKVNILVKSLNSPHSGHIHFTFDENTRKIKMEFLFPNSTILPQMSEINGTEYIGNI